MRHGWLPISQLRAAVPHECDSVPEARFIRSMVCTGHGLFQGRNLFHGYMDVDSRCSAPSGPEFVVTDYVGYARAAAVWFFLRHREAFVEKSFTERLLGQRTLCKSLSHRNGDDRSKISQCVN